MELIRYSIFRSLPTELAELTNYVIDCALPYIARLSLVRDISVCEASQFLGDMVGLDLDLDLDS